MPLSIATTNNNNLKHITHLLNQSKPISHSHLKQIHAQILRTIHTPNSFTWNILIRSYSYSKSTLHKHKAILLYKAIITEQENEQVFPDKHTYPFVLKACAYLFSLFEGKQVHAHLLKHGFELDTYICNSLIHFYASCGCLEMARKVFDRMCERRNVVSWNVMIDSYAKVGEYDIVLIMFCEMMKVYEPDCYTIQSVIRACGGLGSLSLGMWVHAYVLKKCDENVVCDVLVNTCLVDMYCKCGSLEIAKQVFEGMSYRDVSSWNSIILGFAVHGKAKEALDYFVRMVKVEKIVPNSITFVGVLSACNHSGMVNEGLMYFEMMTKEYNIEPSLVHYGCLVDLYARAGHIQEALNVVSEMPIKPDAVIWRSLLDACYKQHASIELSEEITKQVFESNGSVCGGAYVLLSKVYASASRWNDVGLLRKLMNDKGVSKEPGCSLIEINGAAHEFFAGDTNHPQSKDIYKFMNEIQEKLESIGYVPDYSGAPLIDEINEQKQNTMRLHSERLAIAFGLLNSKPSMPIRVFKNLRVCNDCHKVTKLISSIYNVEIIVRDRVRFHHFKDGSCSCMDYW